MGWPSNVAEVQTELTEEQKIEIRDNAIRGWLKLRGQLASVKTDEMTSRTTVSGMLFPTPTKGTQRFELGNGYSIKLVQTYTYTLGDKDKVVDGLKVKVRDQVDDKLDEIEALKLDEEATFILERLIKWVPELSVSEYEKLGESAVGLEIKAKIDEILTVKPGSPQLTFEEPKT